MRHSGRSRRLLGGAAAIAVLAGSLAAFPALSTTLGTFLGKAAAASAMLQMPEGGMAYLQNRFQDDLVQDEPPKARRNQAYRPKARQNPKAKVRFPSRRRPNLHPLRPSRRKTGERSRKRLLPPIEVPCIFRFPQGILRIRPTYPINRFCPCWLSPWNLPWKIPISLRC